MRYEVLYQKRAAWLVGETKEEAASRRANALSTSMPSRQYPNDYAGRVIAIRKSGVKPSLRDMEGDLLQVAELELTREDVESLCSRSQKIGAGVLAPVRFEDRWGKVAETLHANFADAEAAEKQVEDETSLDGRRFAELSALAKKMLPKTVTHTGTGNYFTKASPTKNDDTQSGAPSGQVITLVTGGLGTDDAFIGGYVTNVTRSETRAIVSHTDDTVTLEGSLASWADTDDLDIYDAWSTIQGALDQLWTDQGSATFTASQYVRVFAGTYDETVTPNASFDPDEANGFALVLEGDSTDSRANIDINPTSGSPSYGIYWDCDSGIIRHLTVDGSSVSVMAIRAHTGCTAAFHVRDCEISGPSGVFAQSSHPIGEDCKITFTSGAAFYGNRAVTVRRCEIIGPGKTSGSYAVKSYGNLLAEACTIRSCDVGIQVYDAGAAVIAHCSIYNCNFGIDNGSGLGSIVRVVNAIISSCNYVFYSEAFPSDVAESSRFTQRNNVYYDYATAFAYDGSTTKTYAEWIALGGVDAVDELDQTNPLLTDPANGDFSLQDSSPCINTGHGSGVVTGQNDVAFDAHHPDIGAWSSGEAAGHLTPVLDSWVNVGDGESVTLTVSNVEGSRTVHLFYRLFGSATAFVESPTTRVGPGTLTLGSLQDGATYEVYAISSDGVSSDMPSLPSNILTVTPSLVGTTTTTVREDQGNLDLELDEDCEDIIVPNLDLSLIDGTVQVKQALCIALRTFRGEWFLDNDAGVPYFESVLVKTPDISEINSILKAEILKVTNVNKILEFSSTFDAPNRELSVSFRVDTTFGPVTVEETL